VFFLSPVPPTGEPAPQVLPFWTELIPELWNWTVAAAAAGILELEPYYLLPPVLFFFGLSLLTTTTGGFLSCQVPTGFF